MSLRGCPSLVPWRRARRQRHSATAAAAAARGCRQQPPSCASHTPPTPLDWPAGCAPPWVSSL